MRLDLLQGYQVASLWPHPSGRRLLIRCREGWMGTVASDDPTPSTPARPYLQEYTGALNFKLKLGACISPCGGLVLAPSEDGRVLVWAMDSGLRLVTLVATGECSSVDDHPLGNMPAACGIGRE